MAICLADSIDSCQGIRASREGDCGKFRGLAAEFIAQPPYGTPVLDGRPNLSDIRICTGILINNSRLELHPRRSRGSSTCFTSFIRNNIIVVLPLYLSRRVSEAVGSVSVSLAAEQAHELCGTLIQLGSPRPLSINFSKHETHSQLFWGSSGKLSSGALETRIARHTGTVTVTATGAAAGTGVGVASDNALPSQVTPTPDPAPARGQQRVH